jgi:hypothetical protein
MTLIRIYSLKKNSNLSECHNRECVGSDVENLYMEEITKYCILFTRNINLKNEIKPNKQFVFYFLVNVTFIHSRLEYLGAL